MKTTKYILLAFIFTSSIQSQTKTFMLGFAGTYPEGYSYSGSSGVNWSWYNELSMNFWQGLRDFGFVRRTPSERFSISDLEARK